MYKFFPHTEEDLKLMLEKSGVDSLDELFSQIPQDIRFKDAYQIPSEMSEIEVRRVFDKLAEQNKQLTCFAGFGVYDHYTPAAVPNILQRSEFLTSYTPYQAEISQGTLHYIFEFQSMMTQLTGMEVSNASMYDGTTSAAEAMMMAVAATKKTNKVLVSQTINPKTLKVIETYALHKGIEVVTIDQNEGVTDLNDMKAKLAEGGVAGVIMQQPNVYGIIEDFTGVADECHAAKALFILDTVPVWRSLSRLYVHHLKTHQKNAGKNCRYDERQPRAKSFCTHSPGKGAAHQKTESHFKHLFQPVAHGAFRYGLSCHHGKTRT